MIRLLGSVSALAVLSVFTFAAGSQDQTDPDRPSRPVRPAHPVRTRRTKGLDPRTIRTLHTLEPLMADRAKKFLLLAKRKYKTLDVRAIMGTRTYEEQDALYAIGRTVPGRPVTNARAGQSNHNFNIAFDIGIFERGAYQPESPMYAELGDLADESDLAWGGNWKSRLVDRPHYQWPTDFTLSELRDLKADHELISTQPESLSIAEKDRVFHQTPPPAHETLFERIHQFVQMTEDPSRATPDAIREACPKSLVISEPKWTEDDQAVGNVATMTGLAQGLLIFGPTAFPDHAKTPPAPTALTGIQIYLGDSIKGDLSAIGVEIRHFMTKHLHIPESEKPTIEKPREDLPGVYGYRASWKLKKGRRLDLWQHWYGHKWVLCFYLQP